MQKVSIECIKELKSNKKMFMTEDDFLSSNNATVCHICDEEFDDSEVVNKKGNIKKNKLTKVRDHDHLTGKYRGAAHSCCNIKLSF